MIAALKSIAGPVIARAATMALPLLIAGSALAQSQAGKPPSPPKSQPAPPAVDASRPVGDQTAPEGAKDAAKKAPDAPPPARLTMLAAAMTLKVVHPDDVREKAVARAKELGGFPTLVTDAALHLKVPPDALMPMIEHLGGAGTVFEKSLQRDDRTEKIAQLEAKLRSKREIFQRLRAFLDDSNVQATLQVERSMTNLVAELESVRGQLEAEREAVHHAVVKVSFQFHRAGRVKYVRSPFEWLNGVDLDRFLGAF